MLAQRKRSQKPSCRTDLPWLVMLEILKRCDGRELSILQTVSRELNFFASLPAVWHASIFNNHGFYVPSEAASTWTSMRDIYRNLLEKKSRDEMGARLPFRGFLTDGGILDDDESLWVDNMFHRNISTLYSSSFSLAKEGIKCIGLYRPGHGLPSTIAHRPIQPDIHTRQPDTKCIHFDRSLSVSKPLITSNNFRKLVLTNRIQVNRSQSFVMNPVQRGAVFLGEERSILSEQEGDTVEALYSKAASSMAVELNKIDNLESMFVACQDGTISKPVRIGIEVGGRGEWAEFGDTEATCEGFRPAVWFRFFTQAEKSGGWMDKQRILTRSKVLTDKFEALGAKVVLRKLDCVNSPLPSGILDIPLMKPMVGDAACILLSSSENVMSGMDVMDMEIEMEENVEINYVWMYGWEIEF